MNSLQRGVINIVYSALTGEKMLLPNDFDFAEGVALAQKHKIEVMFYYGALNCGFDQENPLMQQLFLQTCKHMLISEQQMYELGYIFEAFNEEAIDYMPLKGAVLKQFYPKPEMRSMSDADILIRFEKYKDTIIPVMKRLGFKEGRVSDNELVWEKPQVCIELHRRLIPSYNKDYYAYYGDGWRLAKKHNGHLYSMTDEDQMIYLFTHFSKHYRDSGIGIRHLVDLWVFKSHFKNLNNDYIKEELQKLGLFVFYENVMKTIKVWFEQEKCDDISDFITQVIFKSGVYGTSESHVLSDALKLTKSNGKENVRRTKFKTEIFPDYDYIKKRYPVLNKMRFLLPLFWIVRLFDAVIFRRKNIKDKYEKAKMINDESVSNYQSALNYVGLDFNFKE